MASNSTKDSEAAIGNHTKSFYAEWFEMGTFSDRILVLADTKKSKIKLLVGSICRLLFWSQRCSDFATWAIIATREITDEMRGHSPYSIDYECYFNVGMNLYGRKFGIPGLITLSAQRLTNQAKQKDHILDGCNNTIFKIPGLGATAELKVAA
ncbi:hypothetical protein EJ04DRAFT_569628 [Polyplosphaeria fusca]|uniref:Uncharacterized protein n=1 Tax=Polyplosphaeria fusca TaxID=682080 RepID=A0A9P4QMX1_9PLEO|nr:hypothetical protein EJ04DRAFT_569628 [Polyplosphaeria fusca]